MDFNLIFNNNRSCRVNEERLSGMINGDKKIALHLNIWERIKDFFRDDKKSNAYKELYEILHHTDDGTKLDAFNKLISFATPECEKYFHKEISGKEVLFYIADKKVGQSSLCKLMNIHEQTPLYDMSASEQHLFLKMLDTLRRNDGLYRDSYASDIRLEMYEEHYPELLELYRPQTMVEDSGTELKNVDFLSYSEEKSLNYLKHKAAMKLTHQFSSMGYQKIESRVVFTMVHPSIDYLIKAYSKSYYNGESSTELNSDKMKVLNEIYNTYTYSYGGGIKLEVDNVLEKIYNAYDGTLNISCAGKNYNKLAYPHRTL
ncbi:hypothetical protein [uncultured Cedecea sp.]|uniref:hypothetical protein n=1 Tax=uncultured Cedecea sp. TaxID=988762 RepID=UPI002635B846|nr:hypothetical protein [uncultured Cedecea sp.]